MNKARLEKIRDLINSDAGDRLPAVLAELFYEVERLKKNNNTMIEILEMHAKFIVPNPKYRRDFRKEFE